MAKEEKVNMRKSCRRSRRSRRSRRKEFSLSRRKVERMRQIEWKFEEEVGEDEGSYFITFLSL